MSKAMEQLTRGRYADAPGLVQALLDESRGIFIWRPVRAAALLAMAELQTEGERVWMTLEQFATWRTRMGFGGARNAYRGIRDAIGMAPTRVKALAAGLQGEAVTPISRVEALACAHYALGLDMPCAAGDVDAFSAWFGPRFGGAEHAARWIKIRAEFITDRLRGYDLIAGRRKVRTPEADLIRALDWIWRMGPASPYGIRPPAEIWPGQGDLP